MLGALGALVTDAGAATVVLDMILWEEDGERRRNVTGRRNGTAPMTRFWRRRSHVCRLWRDTHFVSMATRRLYRPAVLRRCRLCWPGRRRARARRSCLVSDVECMVRALAKAAAGSGFLNAAPDPDGMLRVLPLVIEYRGRQYPSLALSTLIAYKHTSHMEFHVDTRGAAWLRLDNQEVPLEGRSGVPVTAIPGRAPLIPIMCRRRTCSAAARRPGRLTTRW